MIFKKKRERERKLKSFLWEIAVLIVCYLMKYCNLQMFFVNFVLGPGPFSVVIKEMKERDHTSRLQGVRVVNLINIIYT